MDEKFKREIITTADGSTTIHLPELNEHYHSKHGAINEAKHVFITHGLHYFIETQRPDHINILEIGFGTGLNAFITFLESERNNQLIRYAGVEAYPVPLEEAKLMNYPEALSVSGKASFFEMMHTSAWENPIEISAKFRLTKRQLFFDDIKENNAYNLIYFDAFGARVQPDLWTETIFQKMYNALQSNGVLVTYSAKGSVRRAMQAVGFTVERLPGPPGKREMLRALKV